MQEIPAAGSRQEGFSNLTDEHALQQEADRIPVPADADSDESVGTFSARTQPGCSYICGFGGCTISSYF
jgi:hypothetical protein